jgi:hypothetical protein
MSDAERLRDLTVIENDDGIRPAGPKNACFYCKSKIGQKHSYTCAVVIQEIELVAIFKRFDKAARFRVTVPFHWKEDDILHHFNESGWCAENIIYYEERQKPDEPSVARAASAMLGLKGKDQCLCGFVEVELSKVIDKGPYIEKYDPNDDPEDEEHP